MDEINLLDKAAKAYADAAVPHGLWGEARRRLIAKAYLQGVADHAEMIARRLAKLSTDVRGMPE